MRPLEPPASSAGTARFLLHLVVHARLILGLGLLAAVLVGAWTFMRPRMYTSRASFIPERSSQDRGGVAGLAATFGITLGATSPAESPQFYADLLETDEILRRVAQRHYPTSASDSAPLAVLLGVSADTPEETLDETVQLLRKRSTLDPNPRTGVIAVAVRSPSPTLSQQLAAAFMASLNDFNVANRNSRASAERKFVEGRLAEYQAELRRAEDRFETFLRANRMVASPELQLQQDRHEREIAMLQQVVTSLAGMYEQARIDEVRGTPAIRVIEQPRAAAVADARGTLRNAFIAGTLGAVLGLLLSLARERGFTMAAVGRRARAGASRPGPAVG